MTWLREDRWKALQWLKDEAADQQFDPSERQSLLVRYPP